MRCTLRVFVVTLAFAASAAAVSAQCPQACPEHRNISVAGAGVATAEADLAIVRVGYKLYGPDAKTAYAAAVETSNAIMQALTASGIAKTAIESTSQIIQHTALYELQQMMLGTPDQSQRAFTVTQSWVVRVKPDEAGKALNTAISPAPTRAAGSSGSSTIPMLCWREPLPMRLTMPASSPSKSPSALVSVSVTLSASPRTTAAPRA
jgi:uncharacterized protein YggE